MKKLQVFVSREDMLEGALLKERRLADRLAKALRPMEIIADDHFAAGQVAGAKSALASYRLARGKGK